MIADGAIGARAVADASPRDLASEWGAAEPGAMPPAARAVPQPREASRRQTIRKP